MGMTRKQISFDLSQDALKRYYPHKEAGQDSQFFKRAYKDIRRFMEANGFERRQYSVYVSLQQRTSLDVALLAQRMGEALPWLRLCVKDITVTNIGARHSLLGCCAPMRCPPNSFRLLPNRFKKREKCRSDSQGMCLSIPRLCCT